MQSSNTKHWSASANRKPETFYKHFINNQVLKLHKLSVVKLWYKWLKCRAVTGRGGVVTMIHTTWESSVHDQYHGQYQILFNHRELYSPDTVIFRCWGETEETLSLIRDNVLWSGSEHRRAETGVSGVSGDQGAAATHCCRLHWLTLSEQRLDQSETRIAAGRDNVAPLSSNQRRDWE